MQCEFILHAYIIAWTGDIPALSKVINITDHNSYSGCRFCDIKGIYSEKHKHIYFLTDLKKIYIKKNNLTWLTRINEIKTAITIKEKETLMVIIIIIYIIEFIIVINNLIYLILEIKEKSILFELQLIKFPRSFPIDIMHLFFKNVASYMFKLWSNQIFKYHVGYKAEEWAN